MRALHKDGSSNSTAGVDPESLSPPDVASPVGQGLSREGLKEAPKRMALTPSQKPVPDGASATRLFLLMPHHLPLLFRTAL